MLSQGRSSPFFCSQTGLFSKFSLPISFPFESRGSFNVEPGEGKMVGLEVALTRFVSPKPCLPSSFVSFSDLPFSRSTLSSMTHFSSISWNNPPLTSCLFEDHNHHPHIHPPSLLFSTACPSRPFSYQPPFTLRHFFFVPDVLPSP